MLCTKRHAHAYFVSSLRYRVRHYSVNSDSRKDQRHQRKTANRVVLNRDRAIDLDNKLSIVPTLATGCSPSSAHYFARRSRIAVASPLVG